MKYKSYPQYKDTCVEWLNEVPVNWNIIRLKHLTRESDERNGPVPHGVMLSVSGYRGIEIKDYEFEEQKRDDDDLETYRVVHEGQLVVNTMWLNYAGLGLSKYEGYVSPAYKAYYVNSGIDRGYLHHFLRSTACVEGYKKYLRGIRPNSLQMPSEDFSSFPVLVPPLPTQRAIAAFLDAEIARIDGLVKEYEELIALLAEKRTALIAHAVTRGLSELVRSDDPEFGEWEKPVRFKDSGVEWIGEIPEGWKCIKMKYGLLQNDGGFWGEEPNNKNDDYIVLRSTEQNVDGSWRIIEPALRSLSDDEFIFAKLIEGDLLITKSSGSSLHIGKTSIVTKEVEGLNCAYSNFMQRLRVGCEFMPMYVWYVLNNTIVREQFDFLSNSTTGLANLSQAMIDDIMITLPSLSVQSWIVRYLEKETEIMDALRQETETAISLLKEHRAALITNAVTGKINVEGLV